MPSLVGSEMCIRDSNQTTKPNNNNNNNNNNGMTWEQKAQRMGMNIELSNNFQFLKDLYKFHIVIVETCGEGTMDGMINVHTGEPACECAIFIVYKLTQRKYMKYKQTRSAYA
eukprot:TRINITY_DN6496_c0_g1_i5.p3 TRINITY_DN6496_c0_g1~~TRINITY_DN6496_c0_g1_i5.p3  ORF type:complete len:113 (+),score=13.51 TRINITY_DN6496_c0_g1_i5:101-439(+)